MTMPQPFRFNFANTREAIDVAILLGFLAICVLAAITGFVMWGVWLWQLIEASGR